jgi:phosphoglycolate phosphatase-like HAD superfamily hydrolase
MRTAMMKLILFDLDGTLVSTGGAGLRALDVAFLSLQRLARASEGISFAGRVDPAIIKDIFQTKLRRTPSENELRSLADHYLTALAMELASADHYRILDGVEALLAALAARPDVFLALGTGNLERGARLKLERSGLNSYFVIGGFGSDAEDRAEVLRIGVRRAEEKAGRPFAPRDVFVVGDTPYDVAAGRALGAVTVAVGSGHAAREELLAAGPDHFLPSLKEKDAFLGLLAATAPAGRSRPKAGVAKPDGIPDCPPSAGRRSAQKLSRKSPMKNLGKAGLLAGLVLGSGVEALDNVSVVSGTVAYFERVFGVRGRTSAWFVNGTSSTINYAFPGKGNVNFRLAEPAPGQRYVDQIQVEPEMGVLTSPQAAAYATFLAGELARSSALSCAPLRNDQDGINAFMTYSCKEKGNPAALTEMSVTVQSVGGKNLVFARFSPKKR